MKVSMKTFMPVAAAALVTRGACERVVSRAERYMENRPQKELDMLLVGNDGSYKEHAKIQSRLDSTAFRDIFNGTAAAKDSATVEEFNKIAASYRADEAATTDGKIVQSIRNKLIDKGITVKELGDIYTPAVTKFQHKADAWAYRNFFNKLGIWHDVEKSFNDASTIICP